MKLPSIFKSDFEERIKKIDKNSKYSNERLERLKEITEQALGHEQELVEEIARLKAENKDLKAKLYARK